MTINNNRPGGTSGYITPTGNEILTNKDIDGGTASNTNRWTAPKASSATLAGLTRKEATLVYDTDLGRFLGDNGATLTPIGSSGSGSGEINVIPNPSAENNLDDVTDGTSHTTTRLATGGPLDPVTPTAFSISASTTAVESSTSGHRQAIVMPDALKNTKLKLEMYLETEASQTWKLSVWAGATRVALSTDSSGSTTIPAGYNGKFTCYLDVDNSTNYTVNITRTAGASTSVLIYTGAVFGPGIQPQGAVVSDFVELTPAIGDFSNNSGLGISSADSFLRYRRIGNHIQIKAKYLFTGTGSSGSSFRWNYAPLGSSITLDVTKSPEFAIATRFNSGEPNYGVMKFTQTTYAEFGLDGSAASARGDEFGAGAGLTAFLSFDVMLPVSQWVGGGTLAVGENSIEYAFNTDTTDTDNATAFGYGPQGTPFPSSVAALRKKRVRFQTPIKRGESVYIIIRKDLNSPWAVLTAVDTSCSVQPLMRQGTAFYGIGVDTAYINDTDVDINFGTYSFANDALYFNTGNSWSTASGYWCAVKCTQAAAVGFGRVNANEYGLSPPQGARKTGNLTVGSWSHGGSITTALSREIAYQTIDGQWRVKFNIKFVLSGASTNNIGTFVITGFTAKNDSNGEQGVCLIAQNNQIGFSTYITPNTGTCTWASSAVIGDASYHVFGDIDVETKPSWA